MTAPRFLILPLYSDLAIKRGMSRFKQAIGDGLRLRTNERWATKVDVAVHVLNPTLELGHPISGRIA